MSKIKAADDRCPEVGSNWDGSSKRGRDEDE